MAWVAPETGWLASDTVANTDLNEIGNNLVFLSGTQGSVALGLAAGDWTAGAPTCTMTYRMYEYVAGTPKVIEANFTRVLAASNSNTMTSIGWPAILLPANDIFIPIIIYDAGSPYPGMVEIDSVGNIVWYILDAAAIPQAAGFAAAGNKGFPAFTIHYPIA